MDKQSITVQTPSPLDDESGAEKAVAGSHASEQLSGIIQDQSPASSQDKSAARREASESIPLDRLAGLKENWKTDIVSGFIIFLIALPLSLGIAMASGVPPMAGLIAAIVGGLLVSQTSGSFVTINGPAAGLIVVVLGCVERLGGGDVGYHCTLAAAVIAGLVLTVLGLCKAGKLGEFFPASVVHGMLAAIGLIIIVKQIPVLLGIKPPAKEPFELIAKIPEMLANLNPEVALIGLVSLTILVIHMNIKGGFIKKIPAPLIAVGASLILGIVFNLESQHTYALAGHTYSIIPSKVLVVLPSNIAAGFTLPDFSKVASGAFWFSVLTIVFVQGLETLLSAAAVDKLDLYKRKANLSKDVAAVGFGSAVSAAIGGLPMIAEIVRSTANVMAGGKTRWSNFFHGAFILIFLLFGASLIDKIPLSALAALLMVAGYKLAAPAVWKKTHEIGIEQTALFAITVITTLKTDLMVGVGVGVAAKFILHLCNGAPITALFKAKVDTEIKGDDVYVTIKPVAIFSNYLSIKAELDKIPPRKNVTVDLSQSRLVDHTVMERLHDYESDYTRVDGHFHVVGLQNHKRNSKHPMCTHRLPRKLEA